MSDEKRGVGETFTAWVTKRWLTSGIAKVQARYSGHQDDIVVTSGDFDGFVSGVDWCRTHEEAVRRVRSMIREKRAGLLHELVYLDSREVALDIDKE